jgi:signal transduction histidine kinase
MIKALKEKRLPRETIFVKSNIIKRNSCGCKENSNDEKAFLSSDDAYKNTVINYLQREIGKSYDIASDLLIANISEIKGLVPKIVQNYSVQCIGFWNNDSNNKKELLIKQLINERSKTTINLDSYCPIEDFPPVEFMQCVKKSDIEDIVWIIPVSTTSRNWCIIAYIAPFDIKNLLSIYDISVVLFNLLGIFLDHTVANKKLKHTLETLQQTLATLQQTQEQLIQSEKMVSLGRLVAGVAHEINTPIGVSVTAASYIKDSSDQLMELFESGKLTRSDMINFMKKNSEIADILLLNLNKASNLVKSFKQVAVDQSHEEKRTFNVKDYVNEVLLSLTPKLKKTNVVVDVDCNDNIEIYNYPGGLSQILTNLVVNSLMHAYKEGEKGNISIKIYNDDSALNIIYSDNGKGIEKDDLSKIFDPFFTTRRGSGGTGLGLNMVYNIVTQQYGGTIKCESTPGNGATFIIKIPVS